ncbi:unnamed protein product, partial [Allacma fusca]
MSVPLVLGRNYSLFERQSGKEKRSLSLSVNNCLRRDTEVIMASSVAVMEQIQPSAAPRKYLTQVEKISNAIDNGEG